MINRRTLLAGLVGAGAATLIGTETAAAATFLKWNRPTVYVWSTISSAWYAGSAVEAWDDSSKLDLITRYSKPPTTSVIKVIYADLPSGVLGRCDRALDGMGRIKSAIVRINRKINLGVFEKERRVALIRHEIGHCLGFNHSRTGTDVMGEKIVKGGPTSLSAFHKTRLAEVYR